MRKILKCYTLFLLVISLFFCSAQLYLTYKSNLILSKLKSEKVPLTLRQLAEFQNLPPNTKNAADIYQKTFLAYKESPNNVGSEITGFISGIPSYKTPTKKTISLAESWLVSNSECLRYCEEAATLKSCRYEIDFSRGSFSLELKHLWQLQKIVELIRLKIFMELQDKDIEGAIHWLKVGIKAARSLESEPLLISALVANSMYNNLIDTTNFLLHEKSLNADQLKTLQDALSKIKPEKQMMVMLKGETALGVNCIRDGKPLSEIIERFKRFLPA